MQSSLLRYWKFTPDIPDEESEEKKESKVKNLKGKEKEKEQEKEGENPTESTSHLRQRHQKKIPVRCLLAMDFHSV
jgi:hypothetical protein